MTHRLKHWTWLTTELDTSDEIWKQRFGAMRQAGIDAILPEVFNNHAAAYGSGHLPVQGEWLEQILPLAKAVGLEVHAWMHTMTCNIPKIAAAHPEWYAVNGRGESAADKPAYVDYYKFLCPSRPEVQQFLQKRVEELAAYEIDSVHLDYIRFPDVILASALQPNYGIVQDREYPQFDYCYCEVCRRAFKEQTGIDPLKINDPSANGAWRQFRFDRISNLVRQHLAPQARQGGKAVSAAVFPNWQHVRQEWSTWDLDAVLPMLYHSFYQADISWVREKCAAGVAALPAQVPLYSGLFVPALSPEQMPAAIEASVAGGAKGVSLFAANSMSKAHWDSFRDAVEPLA